MANFQYYTPTKVIFGKETEKRTGEMVKAFGGKKCLLHYGGKSAIASGLIDAVKASLKEAGVGFVELGGVVPNPELHKVREGIALAQKEGVDFILAVGGGSVIDSSKAIAYGLAEPEKDVWELYEHTRQAEKCLPVGVVLTIAAAGSEMSNSSVITNEKTKQKRGCNSDLCRPRFAIMNPELTMSLPDYQTQAGCTDIMMHTMERYFTNNGSHMELTDQLAEALLRTVMTNAEILHKEPKNYEARAEIMWASSLSHNGLTGCGNGGDDFASHRLEHELSGMYGVTHGAGLAAVWGSWARYVMDNCMPRFTRFAEKVALVERPAGMSDKDYALRGVEAIEAFFKRIGMPTSISEMGITLTDEDIKMLALGCEKAVGGKIGSAKVLYRDDMEKIYAMAR